MNSSLPAGTVTFLFTDIEGSTELWEKHPDAMKTALARHDALLRETIGAHQGYIIKGRGDGIHAVFVTALEAVQATLAAQRALQTPSFLDDAGVAIRVRMGLHTGEAELRDGDYYGQALNRAARLMSAGSGGQILLSEVTAQLAREHLPEGVALLDLGEHRLKDLLHVERVYQLAAPGLQKDFPALSAISATTNNLPTQLTSFIGRERELVQAQAKLANARLLTLIGPGGIGKTRLALQLAAQQLPRFNDGAWLVELAPITDPALVVATVASVFSLRELPGTPLIDLVIDYLRDKELLLVLDNCEHLVEAGAHLSGQLLHACARLKIIASSREALDVNGETVFRIPSLQLPDQAAGPLMDCEATRLFAERATRAEPRFQVTPDNAPALVQICRRLDGIPLAIELAAARVRLFTPEQIAQRLDDRFKLLTGGSRTALPRQQTLRALIDWSYQSLNDVEQRALRRLAVFPGGWTFEAAEAVVGEAETLDGLSGLVNKSLVNVEERDGVARHHFLETIRQYALEKLVDSGEATAARDRHLDYFLNRMTQSPQSMYDSATPEALDETEAEYDNLRAALEWATSNRPTSALKLAHALGGFWAERDYNSEARARCAAILEATESLPGVSLDRARLYALFAWSSVTIGRHKEGRVAAEQAIALATEANDPTVLARAYSALALTFTFLGDYAAAQPAVMAAEKIASENDLKLELSFILSTRAQMAYHVERNPDRAKAYLDESAKMARAAGYRWAATISTFGLARVAALLGDLETARTKFSESTEIALRVGNKHMVYAGQSEFAHALREHGQIDEALELYQGVLPKWRDIGHRSAVAHELECVAYILAKKDGQARAATLLGAAEALREVIDSGMTPMETVEYEKEIAALRAGMDETEFQRCWREGRTLTLDQAIAYALAPNAGKPDS